MEREGWACVVVLIVLPYLCEEEEEESDCGRLPAVVSAKPKSEEEEATAEAERVEAWCVAGRASCLVVLREDEVL